MTNESRTFWFQIKSYKVFMTSLIKSWFVHWFHVNIIRDFRDNSSFWFKRSTFFHDASLTFLFSFLIWIFMTNWFKFCKRVKLYSLIFSLRKYNRNVFSNDFIVADERLFLTRFSKNFQLFCEIKSFLSWENVLRNWRIINDSFCWRMICVSTMISMKWKYIALSVNLITNENLRIFEYNATSSTKDSCAKSSHSRMFMWSNERSDRVKMTRKRRSMRYKKLNFIMNFSSMINSRMCRKFRCSLIKLFSLKSWNDV